MVESKRAKWVERVITFATGIIFILLTQFLMTCWDNNKIMNDKIDRKADKDYVDAQIEKVKADMMKQDTQLREDLKKYAEEMKDDLREIRNYIYK